MRKVRSKRSVWESFGTFRVCILAQQNIWFRNTMAPKNDLACEGHQKCKPQYVSFLIFTLRTLFKPHFLKKVLLAAARSTFLKSDFEHFRQTKSRFLTSGRLLNPHFFPYCSLLSLSKRLWSRNCSKQKTQNLQISFDLCVLFCKRIRSGRHDGEF